MSQRDQLMRGRQSARNLLAEAVCVAAVAGFASLSGCASVFKPYHYISFEHTPGVAVLGRREHPSKEIYTPEIPTKYRLDRELYNIRMELYL